MYILWSETKAAPNGATNTDRGLAIHHETTLVLPASPLGAPRHAVNELLDPGRHVARGVEHRFRLVDNVSVAGPGRDKPLPHR